MPAHWQDEAQRTAYYQALPQPVQVTSFIDPLREQLTQALSQFNRDLPQNPSMSTSRPQQPMTIGGCLLSIACRPNPNRRVWAGSKTFSASAMGWWTSSISLSKPTV